MEELSSISGTRVFLSYSRDDSSFTQRLASALQADGYVVSFDRSSSRHIDPDLGLGMQGEWWPQLQRMITATEVFVFVVSPASAASHVCDDEIAFAKAMGKRVIAILRRAIDFGSAPQRLQALQVGINFESDDETLFRVSLSALERELDLDRDWLRLGAHLTRLAAEWAASGRTDSHLLRLGAVAQADEWAARRPNLSDAPGKILLEFLSASREKEQRDIEQLRRITGLGFVEPTDLAVRDRCFDRATKLAAAGVLLSHDLSNELVPQRTRSANAALLDKAIIFARAGVRAGHFALDAEGGRIAMIMEGARHVRILDVATAVETVICPEHDSDLVAVAFAPSPSEAIVLCGKDGRVQIWDSRKLELKQEIPVTVPHPKRCEFSHDGRLFVLQAAEKIALCSTADATLLDCVALRSGWERVHFNLTDTIILSRAEVFCIDDGRLVRVASSAETTIGYSLAERPIFVTESVNEHATGRSYSVWSGTPKILDALTGEHIRDLDLPAGHRGGIGDVVISPDGAVIVQCHSEGLEFWDATTGKLVRQVQALGGFAAADVTFTSDSTRVLACRDTGVLNILEGRTGELLCAVPEAYIDIRTAQISADDKRLAAIRDGDQLVLLDLAHTRVVARAHHDGSPTQISFSPDGSIFASASRDQDLRVFAISNPEGGIHERHKFYGRVEKLAWISNSVLAAKDSISVWLFPMAGGRARQVGHYHDQVADVATNVSAERCAVLFREGRVEIIDARDGAFSVQWQTGRKRGRAIAWSADGSRLATTDHDGALQLWEPSGKEIAAVLDAKGDWAKVCWSRRGVIGIACADTGFMVFNGTSGVPLSQLKTAQRSRGPEVIDADNLVVARCHDSDTLAVLSLETGENIRPERSYGASIQSLALSVDRDRILVGLTGSVVVEDLRSGAEIARLATGEYNQVLAEDPSGDLLAFGGNKISDIWDVRRIRALSENLTLSLALATEFDGALAPRDLAKNIVLTLAPENLHAALMDALREQKLHQLTPDMLAARRQAFWSQRHPHCYQALSLKHK